MSDEKVDETATRVEEIEETAPKETAAESSTKEEDDVITPIRVRKPSETPSTRSRKESEAQVDEEPLEDKVPEPPIMTLDKVATILLIGAGCLVLRSLVSSLGCGCCSWLIAFALWVASSIAYVVISSKKVLPCGKSVLITGCDTGFGHSLALNLEKLGFLVFALCLKDEDGAAKLRDVDSANLHVIIGDVTKPDDLKKARKVVEENLPEGDGLWGLVNNAGISTFGDVEWVPLSTFRKLFEVNVFGMVGVIKTFAPLLRRAKGRIVNISSMMGRMPVAMRSPYVISKFAVEGFSDCLRHEMKMWDVKVIVVEPGNFTAGTSIYTEEGVEKSGKEMWEGMDEEVRSAYGEEHFKKKIALMKGFIKGGSTDLTIVIDAIVCALTDVTPQVRYQPMDLYFKTRVFAAWHLPECIYDYLYQ